MLIQNFSETPFNQNKLSVVCLLNLVDGIIVTSWTIRGAVCSKIIRIRNQVKHVWGHVHQKCRRYSFRQNIHEDGGTYTLCCVRWDQNTGTYIHMLSEAAVYRLPGRKREWELLVWSYFKPCSTAEMKRDIDTDIDTDTDHSRQYLEFEFFFFAFSEEGWLIRTRPGSFFVGFSPTGEVKMYVRLKWHLWTACLQNKPGLRV